MQRILILLVLIPVAYIISVSFRSEPEGPKSDKEIVLEQFEDLTINQPKTISVLLNRKQTNQQTREIVKTYILKTYEELLPKAQRIPHSADDVITEMNRHLPDYEFGAPEGKGSFFRLVNANEDWQVTAVKTSEGYYSQWVQVTDIHQLRSNE